MKRKLKPKAPQPLARRIPVLLDGEVSVATMVECLAAAHLTNYVDSPFHERGGIMLVGPPGSLRTTIARALERSYADVMCLSDINQKGLTDLKQHIITGDRRTLVFTEYSKLYERNPHTASNAEGTIRAMVAEGFAGAAFEEQTIAKTLARAVVIGAMAERFRALHAQAWDDTGFARRFLWALVHLKRPELLMRAVEDWRPIPFHLKYLPPVPVPNIDNVEHYTTAEERQSIKLMVKHQPGPHTVQAQLLCKMLAVLKWWYKEQGSDPEQGYRVLAEFARALGPNGAELVV
jgi:hypothetical protein